MKDTLIALLGQTVEKLQADNHIPADLQPDIQITNTKDASHGDLATNLAMMLAKPAGKNPREMATLIIDNLPANDLVEKVDIAGPGFINFFIKSGSTLSVVKNILDQAENFGLSELGKGKKIQVEFVSANPTGPLHVGHGRGAAYGATVADLYEAVGYEVHREYYVNDAGRQMDILGTSIWLRYLEKCGIDFEFPVNGYKGDYIYDIATEIETEYEDKFVFTHEELMNGIPADEPHGGDKELHIDALISRAKELLGKASYRIIFDSGLNSIIGDIRDDLKHFGIEYQDWYSERTLEDRNLVSKAIERLQTAGHIYEKDGALWFRSTDFGDEKDRVVKRDNGQTTYFASDIAYHMEKIERGYDIVIDVWGADHHGYVPRVRAALQALGDDADKLKVLLVQFANLFRGGEKVQMSTRSGSFVTLRELREEVGNDAARFFYVMRKCEQHLDFDLDLAKSQSNDNPVYYIQYAHARVCSVLRQLKEKNLTHDTNNGQSNLPLLTEPHEISLVKKLNQYTSTLESAAIKAEPHLMVHYLRELASELHTYYNAHQFIVDDKNIRDARLNLIIACRQIIANGLKLLGVSAPEAM
ncbi:MAG: arginine--tRNA ligase [Gammaproteobacteria bacterium]|nr:arginine--tRNA ligase [Gammaproteobacteria bacterium]